jgi:hypothetical protein
MTKANRYVAEAIDLLEDLLKRNDPEGFGCACVPDKWRCGPCSATEQQKPIHAVIKALRAYGVPAVAIHHPGTSCRQQNEAGQCGCPWGQCARAAGVKGGDDGR